MAVPTTAGRFAALAVSVLLLAGCSAAPAAAPQSSPSGSSAASSSAASSSAAPTTAVPSTAVPSTAVPSSSGASAASAAASAPVSFAAPRTVPDGMGSGQPDGQFPRTVTHFGGSTTIPAAPQRVVAISTGQLDGLLTLGVVPVGTTRGTGASLVPAYLASAFPDRAEQLSRLADLGTRQEPNLEAIAAAKPDLILVNKAGAADYLDQLQAIAPTVLTEGTGVNWKQDFLLLADALGRTQQAQGVLDAFHATAAAHATGVVPSVSLIRTTPDRTRIFGVASFAGSIAQDAGFARPASQQFEKTSEDLSAEQLDRADADWIFSGVQAGAEGQSVTTNPIWPTLGAVKAGHVVPVDDDMWYLNAGPTAAATVLREMISATS